MKSFRYSSKSPLILFVLLTIVSSLPAIAANSFKKSLTELNQSRAILIAKKQGSSHKPYRIWGIKGSHSTQVGAARGACKNEGETITSLLPDHQNNEKPQIFFIDSPYPVVLFDVSKNIVKRGTFFLKKTGDPKNPNLIQVKFETPIQNSSGIVVLNLTEYAQAHHLPEMNLHDSYEWTVELGCDNTDGDHSGDPAISGLIQRIDPNVPLAKQLKIDSSADKDVKIADELQAKDPDTTYQIYAENGIWYSAVSQLADSLANSDDPKIKGDWEELLKVAKLESLSQERIIGLATFL